MFYRTRALALTNICSKPSVSQSTSTASTEFVSEPTSPLVRSKSLGSLTLIRSGVEVFATLGGEVGVEGRSQLSNTLDSRAWERDWRQSVDFVFEGDGGEPSDAALALACLAVPSPSSSSASISWHALIVDSDGSSDMEDVERGCERRYHSSGTENWKERRAFTENGGGRPGA